MRQILAVALLVFVLAGCGKAPSGSPEDENNIRIAVFEYQMSQYSASVYFLSVSAGATDPNAEVMQHFDGHTPPVKTALQGTIGAGGSVNDIQSGDTGVILRAATIEWISTTEAKVKGGYMAGAKAASGVTYQVVLKDGEWVVDEVTVNWSS